MPDSIHALEPSHDQRDNKHSAVYPPCQVDIATGEQADYLLELTRAVGGMVKLDRRRHIARAHIFGGSKAAQAHARPVLPYTGRLSTSIPSVRAHAGVWVCVRELVVRDTRKEFGGISRYPTDHIQHSTVKHTDGRGRGDRLGRGARADCLVGGACARSTRRRHDARYITQT